MTCCKDTRTEKTFLTEFLDYSVALGNGFLRNPFWFDKPGPSKVGLVNMACDSYLRLERFYSPTAVLGRVPAAGSERKWKMTRG